MPVLFAFVLILGCNFRCERLYAPRATRTDLSGRALYEQFLASAESGSVRKHDVTLTDLYHVVNATQENIRFCRGAEERLALSYQRRYPAVFWSWPEPNYFDSDRYYFKLGNEWFHDRFGYFDQQAQLDCISLPAEFFRGEALLDSVVELYDGFEIHLAFEDEASELRSDIIMRADAEQRLRSISAKIFSVWNGEHPRRVYTIHYQDVNAGIPVKKPEDLVTRL